MEEVLKIVDSLIPVVAALGGAFVGGYFTRKNQKELYDRQIDIEKKKEEKEAIKETLLVYNKILKVDGEQMVIIHIGGPNYEFEIDIYREKVRPILYERYHILHSNVAKLVRSIDMLIQKSARNEEVEDEDNALLMRNYSKMINHIIEHIYEFRSDK